MSIKLTPYEKETIIITSEGDDEFIFDTFSTRYKNKLAGLAEKYPSHCRLTRTTPEGSAKYFVSKECVSIHFTEPYSEERRQKARKQAEKNGLIS